MLILLILWLKSPLQVSSLLKTCQYTNHVYCMNNLTLFRRVLPSGSGPALPPILDVDSDDEDQSVYLYIVVTT